MKQQIIRSLLQGLGAAYDPTQPRYPKGHPMGGQWKDMDVEAVAKKYKLSARQKRAINDDTESFKYTLAAGKKHHKKLLVAGTAIAETIPKTDKNLKRVLEFSFHDKYTVKYPDGGYKHEERPLRKNDNWKVAIEVFASDVLENPEAVKKYFPELDLSGMEPVIQAVNADIKKYQDARFDNSKSVYRAMHIMEYVAMKNQKKIGPAFGEEMGSEKGKFGRTGYVGMSTNMVWCEGFTDWNSYSSGNEMFNTDASPSNRGKVIVEFDLDKIRDVVKRPSYVVGGSLDNKTGGEHSYKSAFEEEVQIPYNEIDVFQGKGFIKQVHVITNRLPEDTTDNYWHKEAADDNEEIRKKIGDTPIVWRTIGQQDYARAERKVNPQSRFQAYADKVDGVW